MSKTILSIVLFYGVPFLYLTIAAFSQAILSRYIEDSWNRGAHRDQAQFLFGSAFVPAWNALFMVIQFWIFVYAICRASLSFAAGCGFFNEFEESIRKGTR